MQCNWALTNAVIFDGHSLLPANTVLIQGGTITAVGKNLSFPKRAKSINCHGQTLLPGLIDAHVHLEHEGQLRQALIFGITTQLDMFMIPLRASFLKLLSRQNPQNYSDLLTAGYTATCKGGHCDFSQSSGWDFPTIDDPGQSESFVDERIAEGSDYIKLIYDDCSAWSSNRLPVLNKETLGAVISAARKRKRLSVVHISRCCDALDVIEAGADGLAHAFMDALPDEKFFQALKRRTTFIIATLTALESICGSGPSGSPLVEDLNLSPYLTLNNIKQLTQPMPGTTISTDGFSNAAKAVQLLKERGMTVLAGTDSPNPGTDHGASLHRELELLVQAGLTATEALTAATAAPAECFKLQEQGRIADGMRADLLLVAGSPTENIIDTRKISQVWRAGLPVDRTSYREILQEERALRKGRADKTPE